MTRLLRFIFRSIKWMLSSPPRYLGLGLVVLLGVAAALGYLYRESIVEAYTSAQDAVLSTLGLGVILVALWLAAFLVALALRRSALKRFNLWVGALAFIAAIGAGLAFFHPDTGALGAFALDGEVSLGGRTGEAIVGTADWVGALRALGAFALAPLIAFPRLTLDLVALSGKLFMISYVLVVVAAKGGVSWLTRMYRFQPATGQSGTSQVRAESEADPPWLTDTQGRVARWPTNATESSKPLPTSVDIETGTATVVESEPDVDQSEEKLPKDGSASVEHRDSGESESSKPLPTSVDIETGTATVVESEPDVDQSEEKLPKDGSASVEHRDSGESESSKPLPTSVDIETGTATVVESEPDVDQSEEKLPKDGSASVEHRDSGESESSKPLPTSVDVETGTATVVESEPDVDQSEEKLPKDGSASVEHRDSGESESSKPLPTSVDIETGTATVVESEPDVDQSEEKLPKDGSASVEHRDSGESESSKPLPTSVDIETGTATVVESEPDVDQSEEKLPKDGSASVEHRDSGESEGGAGKFNKFWSSTEAAANGQSRMSHVQAAEEDDGEAGPTTSDPAEAWKLPPRDLLVDATEGGISEEAMAETAETIKRTLAEYGVEVQTGQIRPGPAVTMYGLIPGWVRRYKQERELDESGKPKLDQSGRPIATRVESKTRVKVDSILSREKDLALALKTPRIRIETPVMGKSQVGVEVPNPSLALVTLRNVMEGKEFQCLHTRAKLPIALGKASGGETVVVDLAKMPHLLVAGATGSGKSVFINTVVSCLIMERSPAEVRLLLVDPKRVELTPYNGIPHLLTPVVVETDQVIGLLKGLIQEMFSRYKRMEKIGVRNIDGYNRKMPDKIPYIVVAVDELADLMMTAAFDVEQSICRLAQLGRATGIHLVVATQRPSVDVVTGLIKANFPSRVSFGVTSQIDSRTILDTVGAEKLLGRGDMLYQAQDASRPERIQGVFISDAEIERVVNFWQTTTWRPLHALSLRAVGTEETEADERVEDDDARGSSDELLQKATELAQHYNKMSTSLLQRRLRIGYPRAARLMDQLEERGIIGPSDGSKSRDVIINRT